MADEKPATGTTNPAGETVMVETQRNVEAKLDEQLGEAGQKALDAFKKRARDAEKQAKQLETRVKEFEERDKTESEKLIGKVESLTSERDTTKQENLRLRVALAKKVPDELIDRLKGSSQEELEADADKLLALVKSEEKPTDFDGGARDPAPEAKPPEQAHGEFLIEKVFGIPPT